MSNDFPGASYDRWKTRSPDDERDDESTEDDESEFDLPLICPVTGAPCLTEQNEFCEDYGCARLNGIDVDGDLYP